MKNPKETSRRWLAQAEHSLRMMGSLLEGRFWAGACFQAEQTAQLALKAFLFWRGRRFVNIHSIRALALECGKEDAQFLAFENYGIFLDRYYLATRYPDALPAPAIPFESFTQQEAQQALGYATEIVELVKVQTPLNNMGVI
jgi:HEPN domain-containing protein